jgi:hypothetical protein
VGNLKEVKPVERIVMCSEVQLADLLCSGVKVIVTVCISLLEDI